MTRFLPDEAATTAFGREMLTHLFRTDRITLEFILEEGKDTVEGADKYLTVRLADPPKVADHPTF